jgi:hypothetical protein
MDRQTPRPPQPHAVRFLRANLGHLLECSRPGAVARDYWASLRGALRAAPLSTGGYALACARLDNAVDYWREGEWGAARFELRLLLGILQ